jgi:hypothetical protein
MNGGLGPFSFSAPSLFFFSLLLSVYLCVYLSISSSFSCFRSNGGLGPGFRLNAFGLSASSLFCNSVYLSLLGIGIGIGIGESLGVASYVACRVVLYIESHIGKAVGESSSDIQKESMNIKLLALRSGTTVME